jgi:biopolymer transport protein ExbD
MNSSAGNTAISNEATFNIQHSTPNIQWPAGVGSVGSSMFHVRCSMFSSLSVMRFLIRKRRTAPAVIIVALIDVLVVLLIFLMVTTTFKQQPLLKLALPESSSARKPGAEEHPPLVVNIDADGSFRFGEQNLPLTLEQLRAQLLTAAAKTPDEKLAIRADRKAPWFRIVNVMDLAKAMKIKNLSAFTKDAARP